MRLLSVMHHARNLTIGLALAAALSHPAEAHSRVAHNQRPSDCFGIPWCGCWARHQEGIADKQFNRTTHWLVLPHVAKQIGAWAVMAHHIGKVVGFDANGNPVLVSGNHNGGVGTGVYRKSRIIAYVKPGWRTLAQF